MGTVMIACPVTHEPISTGIEADRHTFARSPVFFSTVHCRHCKTMHRYFARDAWVEEFQADAVRAA